eukprot:284417_1
MSFQENEVYRFELEGEHWPVVAIGEETAKENGLVDPADGGDYQPIVFLGSGAGMQAPAALISTFSWDDKEKLATENPEILEAIAATQAVLPKPEGDESDMTQEERRAARQAKNEEKARKRA